MEEKTLEQSAIKAALNNKWDKAVELNNRIVEEGYENVNVYNRLGKAYGELGKWKESISSFEKALEFDPVSSVAQKGLENAKMNRKAGVTSSNAYKESLLKDLNTSQIIEVSSKKIQLDHEYKLIKKKDFYILYDKTADKQIKRVGTKNLSLKGNLIPNELKVQVLEIEEDIAKIKLESTQPVFKAEKQQIDPELKLEEKEVEEEKKEIEKLYSQEE